jgi:hypothetical protein
MSDNPYSPPQTDSRVPDPKSDQRRIFYRMILIAVIVMILFIVSGFASFLVFAG